MFTIISIPADALRTALAEDDEYDFAEYENTELGDQFDYMLTQAVRVLNELLPKFPANAHLGGSRTNTFSLQVIPPTESIDLTFVADLTPIIDGYEFSYDVWGERRISLATSFSEFRHIHPESGGIDGCIEAAQFVLDKVNRAILDADAFITAQFPEGDDEDFCDECGGVSGHAKHCSLHPDNIN